MEKIIPKYARIPLLMVVFSNLLVYNASKLITNHFFHYDASIFIDKYIPFLPIFISIYVLSYVQWIAGFIIVARENKEICYQYLSAEIVAKWISFLFFFFFPTTIARPDINGSGIWILLIRFIYFMDAPVNLFPSLHCLESWFCFRGSLPLKKVPKWYKVLMFVFTIFVCLSTVFVKQHVFLDIFGGIIIMEIGLFISKRFSTGKIFEKIEGRLKSKNK